MLPLHEYGDVYLSISTFIMVAIIIPAIIPKMDSWIPLGNLFIDNEYFEDFYYIVLLVINIAFFTILSMVGVEEGGFLSD